MKMKYVLIAIPLLFAMGCKEELKEPDYYHFRVTEAEMATGQTVFTVPPTTTYTEILFESNMWWNLAVTYPDPNAAGWLSITPTTGRGNMKFEITVEENFHNYARSAVIRLTPDGASEFSGYSFTYTQQLRPPFIIISGDEITDDVLNIGVVGGIADVVIHSNIAWTVTYSDAPSWYPLSVASGGGDDVVDRLTSTYEINATGVIREGRMNFSGEGGFTKTLTVKQKEEFDQSELTIDNGANLIANWTQCIGTDTYTLRFFDISDVEIPNSAITGIDKNTFSHNLTTHFSEISSPYIGEFKVMLVANTVEPAVYSESNVVSSHTHFGNGSGDGSTGSEYTIASVRHLKNINVLDNAGEPTLSKHYKQIADLDFTDETASTYTPVASLATQRFMGTYSGAKEDGGVYRIMNTSFVISTAIQNWGIFGHIGEEGKVGNLEFKDCALTINTGAAPGDAGHGFAHAVGGNIGGEVHHITLTDCTIDVTTNIGFNTGGVVGSNYNVFSGTATVYTETAFGWVHHCTTSGGRIRQTASTDGGNWVGGIVGGGRTTSLVEDCINYSTPVTSRGIAGGIAGRVVSLRRCANHAPVEGTGNATGGLVGIVNAYGPGVIEDCYNTGTVTHASGGGASFIGGIVGRMNVGIGDGLAIRRCFNSGTIVSNANNASSLGGIAGDMSNIGEITDCFNAGDVNFNSPNASSYAGGIIANFGNQAFTVSNCYNAGNVGYGTGGSGGGYRGGIAGRMASTTVVNIKNCYHLSGSAFHDEVVAFAEGSASDRVTDCAKKTAADLANPATYDASWDFTTIWEAPSGSYPYPQLRGLPYKTEP